MPGTPNTTLRCHGCGRTRQVDDEDYLFTSAWPRCCGEVMVVERFLTIARRESVAASETGS